MAVQEIGDPRVWVRKRRRMACFVVPGEGVRARGCLVEDSAATGSGSKSEDLAVDTSTEH